MQERWSFAPMGTDQEGNVARPSSNTSVLDGCNGREGRPVFRREVVVVLVVT